MILSTAALFCVLKFPIGDVTAVIQAPLPQRVIRLASDVAGCLPVPHTQTIALGLGVLASGSPSTNPMRDGETFIGRGGRSG